MASRGRRCPAPGTSTSSNATVGNRSAQIRRHFVTVTPGTNPTRSPGRFDGVVTRAGYPTVPAHTGEPTRRRPPQV